MPDAGHHALHEVRRARVVEAPEAERVEVRDRTRAHGEHVAQDAAHARRRALEGLDERGMVVALDLEDRCEPVAHVDRARVLARTLQHARASRRQVAQESARALVRAVLGPHDGEHAELLEGGGAPEQRYDLRPLLAREAVLVRDLGGDRPAHPGADSAGAASEPRATQAWTERKRRRPSTLPVSRSTACSGCVISPTTLRAALHTPAM